MSWDAFEARTGLAPTPTIGSSDVASILGYAHHDASPWRTWARLVGLVERYESTDDPEAAAGRMMEPAIGGRYAIERGLVIGADIMPGPPITAAPFVGREAWMSARPDFTRGAWGAQSNGLARRWIAGAVVEAKSPRVLDPGEGWGEAGTDRVPMYYLVQIVWQMAVLDVDAADLAAFGRVTSDWRVYHFDRRERVERAVVDRVRDWYERHVVEGAPPPIDGSDACGRLLGRVHGQPTREWVTATAADVALARDLARTRAQLAELTERAKSLQHQLQDRIGAAHGIRTDEGPIATWGPRKGAARIDTEALREHHPEIAAKYTTIGQPGRSFSFKLDNTKGNDE